MAGTYKFNGILTLPSGVMNPDNLGATVNVIVGEAPESSASSSSSSSNNDSVTGNGIKTAVTLSEVKLEEVLRQTNNVKITSTNSWGDEALGGTVSNILNNDGEYEGSIITAKEAGAAKLPIEYSSFKDLKYVYKYDVSSNTFIEIKNALNIDNKNIQLPVEKDGIYYVGKTPMTNVVVLQEGWNTVNNATYRVKNGSIKTGWIFENNIWYYVGEDSKIRIENKWSFINGNWYFFNEKGEMKTGWKQSNGKWYYLNESGAMATGWLDDNGTWYYLNSNGSMVHDTRIYGYLLGSSGAYIKE